MNLAPLSTIALCALLSAGAAARPLPIGRAPGILLLKGLVSSIGVTLRDSAAGASCTLFARTVRPQRTSDPAIS